MQLVGITTNEFIKVKKDRSLVPVVDGFGIPIGEVDITDRAKLAQLLSCLKEYDNYRYILCDIAFNDEYKTADDSLLYGLITSMQRIVVPSESPVLPASLSQKAAPSAYKVFHHGDPFMKYQYLIDDERTIPLKMWNDISGNDLFRHWWGYSSTRRAISNNTAVLDFTHILNYAKQTESSREGNLNLEKKMVYHLGADILDADCPPPMFEDRIILIGDFFEQDMHDTAIGQVPGVLLLYAAYRGLVDGANEVPAFCYFALFLIFLAYSLLLAFHGGWRFSDKFLAFLADAFSFTLPLQVFNFLTLLFGGFSVNAVLIGSLFGFVSYIVSHVQK